MQPETDQLRELIEDIRRQRGWSKAKLAAACDLPVTTVYSILDRHRQHYQVRQATLDRLAVGLNIPVATLMLAAAGHIDAVTLQLLNIWRALSNPDRARLLVLAQKIHQARESERPSPPNEGLFLEAPLHREVALGQDVEQP